MDNEATRLINDETTQNEQVISSPQPMPEAPKSKSSKKGNTIAAAAGGFVAGAAVGVGASAAASNSVEEVPVTEDANNEKEQEVVTPAPEEAILANDEGIRVAHVEGNNFNEAFAQARAQVGPGGVFEYDGRLYGTYTSDEWEQMSSEERAEYQNRVNEVAPSHHNSSSNSTQPIELVENAEHTPNVVPANAEMIAVEPVDNEIRILGVEAVTDGNGNIMNVALVENSGDQALLVDVDNNGTIDVMLHDDNNDGQIQEQEIHDISQAGLNITDLEQAHAAQQGDVFYAANDDMPDYINDADSIMSV